MEAAEGGTIAAEAVVGAFPILDRIPCDGESVGGEPCERALGKFGWRKSAFGTSEWRTSERAMSRCGASGCGIY